MAKQRRTTTIGSYLPLALMGLTALGMLGLVGVGVAWFAGVFGGGAAETEPVDRTGKLAFPALARPVAAFEKLTRDDFINPQTRQLNVIWLPEATASVASRNMSELIGRVLSRDKQAGMVLTESDFMEQGTRPGLAAGIPPGKFAVTIPASEVTGLDQLRNGDRFDLLVALPEGEDTEPISGSEPAVLFGGIKPPSLRVGQLSRQHGVKRLVTDGMLVTLFSENGRSTTGPSGLTVPPSNQSSGRSRTKPTTKVVAEIAVDAEEIGPLTQAISLDTQLTCVLRSGQPGAAQDDQFNPDGLVPVITTAKPVPAFSALTDENLIDESTGQLHLYYFPPDEVAQSWITDATELYGRVVSRPLRRGSLITEEDLLPPGTRPGISAGLPSGMAAMSVEKAQVRGFEKLVIGDRFSILTRVPETVQSGLPSVSWATLQGGRLSDDDARVAEMVRTGIREVARDAVYLSQADDSTVVIGISQQQVAKLAQLLRDDSELFVVANSSREPSPNDEERLPTEISVNPFSDASTTRSEAAAEWRFVAQLDVGQASGPSRETVPVPVLSQDVNAFRQLTIDDFIDPSTGQLRMLYFPPDKVDDQWLLDVRDLIDRVAVRSLDAGRVVTRDDLAPPGTPAGPGVGIPQGMRGVTVNSAQVLGLESLAEGSRFDLATADSVDVISLGDEIRQSLASSDAVREAAKLPSGNVSTSRVIANDVLLLSDLGESTITVQTVAAPAQTQTRTRLTPDGSTITEEVIEQPSFASEQRTVRSYILAVPESSLSAVVGMLDVQLPLAASILPLDTANAAQTSMSVSAPRGPGSQMMRTEAPVRAVIQEHVRGTEIRTEVFLTDRPVGRELSRGTADSNAVPARGN
jgi:flagella basal body P-ring formation protein FlgA